MFRKVIAVITAWAAILETTADAIAASGRSAGPDCKGCCLNLMNSLASASSRSASR